MAKPNRRCYYEVLSVSINATDDEIRSTFRRLALRIHPDKQAANGVPIAEATAAFQDLLQAYEVLSDPKERSWYDSHRSQVLSSNPKSAVPSRSSYFSRHSNLDLENFFSPSCFSGFSDSGKGFFKVYGDVFTLIHSQELYFAKKLGLGFDRPPQIGNVYSPYSEFMAFYDYWLGFSTVIDFDWVYDQEEAKNDRNLLVRELVVLVRNLDKRIIDLKGKESEQDEKLREKKRLKKKEKEEEMEEEGIWYNTLSAHQKMFVDNLRKKRNTNTKFTMEKLQAMIKEMQKKQEKKNKKKKKSERMKANKENEIYDECDDDEEKKERDRRRSEGTELDSNNNDDNRTNNPNANGH
ncbi:DNAJ protein JJJ1 homolog [Dioscorea cayenensis subsp. rotundata]|uniref:DNAJ protein JJJ1 homolog n=1 Tax=Dioscorea cayennensis subsp. rotundata TaxID=55577 RepID=A0AB40BWP0_DIOCR|nr:DNAJ protein JJJ1 homolog [Dioscorea cayenensis subsp. rotundata]